MISVIVPIHNSQLYLEECLNSIKDQRFTDIEVLMINDASTDRSEDICKMFEERDPRFRLITQAWSGVCVARNRGLAEAKGEYLSFVDSDDRIEPDFLLKLMKALTSFRADIAACDFYDESGNEHPKWESGCAEGEKIWDNYLKGYYCNRIMNKLYKTSVVRDIEFPKERPLREDAFWTANALQKCRKIATVPMGLYYYRKVEGSLSSGKCRSQEKIVGALYNDLEKFWVIKNNLSKKSEELYYKEFVKWLREVLLSYYDLSLYGFYEKLRGFVLTHDRAKLEREYPAIVSAKNYKEMEKLYLKSYLMDADVPVKSKCKTLARILKRITVR